MARAQSVVLERKVDAWTLATRKATVVRVTARCLVLKVGTEGLAYVHRATGKGQRAARGNPALGGDKAGDWSAWRLRWADWDRYSVADGYEQDTEGE